MEYTGTVTKGVVVLDNGNALPEGARVRVTLTEPPPKTEREKTLGQRLLKFAGSVEGLPNDLAENHDHYLHGRPKK